ncbi:hypothetical protein CH298_02745 [Rhodococcoides fascians]|uniref:hypothetical protein n=1 Tax=Rhodococcoides fascians TaxID=1828 RepID=UPI000B9B263D|nr:hypothetical protein [Rhodococcus fascians]OZE92470.1 hypothetical protein CH303_02745 [Rhodococcus fascians]OZF23103.1 hypothetical protein CH298_02745 [Rhodococcus fascians]OZF24817.1 hypothetical protein CH297_02745 [Rhodococcus fascians]OZF72412.1 hypothetical protein CH308_02750 [Rhodococcus fascians]OZF73710.1 hypothetical protein CH307_02745 [Rhodococcus fascians]
MPRDHGRVLCRIWQDPVFRARTPEAQRLYVVILTQQNVNNAGIVPLMLTKWAKASIHTSVNDVIEALAELVEHRFVLTDEHTEEAFIRSFMRNDGVVKQPNVLKNALRVAKTVESAVLRFEMAQELRRLDRRDADAVADEMDPPGGVSEVSENPSETLPLPIENPTVGVEPFSNPSPKGAGRGRGRGKALVSSNSSSKDSSATKSREPDRFDEFWSLYPKKAGRIDALKAFAKAVKSTDVDLIIAGVQRFAQDPNLPTDKQYIPHPSTWLNGGRWDDEPLPGRNGPQYRDERSGLLVER